MEETDIMPPLLPGPSFLGRPVNARVKAGLGGKEEAPLPLLLWKWQGYGWHLSSGCLGSLPPPVGLQEEESLRLGCRKGSGEGGMGQRTRKWGKVVLSLSFPRGSRVQIGVYHF